MTDNPAHQESTMYDAIYERPGTEPRPCQVLENLGPCSDSEGGRREMLLIRLTPLALPTELTVLADHVSSPSPADWVEIHEAAGHRAAVTQIAAPGTGIGSYCWTCSRYGPDTCRILSLEDYR